VRFVENFHPDGTRWHRTIREGRAIRGEEIIVEREDGTRSRVLADPEPIFSSTG